MVIFGQFGWTWPGVHTVWRGGPQYMYHGGGGDDDDDNSLTVRHQIRGHS